MGAGVGRIRHCSPVVCVRIEARVKLVANVGAVRTIVGRRVVGRMGTGRMTTVAAVPFAHSLVGNLLVLGCARCVAARFVDFRQCAAADGFTSALQQLVTTPVYTQTSIVCLEMCKGLDQGTYMHHVYTLADGFAKTSHVELLLWVEVKIKVRLRCLCSKIRCRGMRN